MRDKTAWQLLALTHITGVSLFNAIALGMFVVITIDRHQTHQTDTATGKVPGLAEV